MSSKIAPIVFNYLDLNSYLMDYYRFRKNAHPDFSYETWAQELELGTSREFLRMIVTGRKKAPTHFVQMFMEHALASNREKDYFDFLVRHSQAPTQKDKQVYASKMIQILKEDLHQQPIENSPAFVSSPDLARLLTLLGFKDILRTEEHLAFLMRLSLEEVQRALLHLQELKLTEKQEADGQTIWIALNERFKVADNKGSLDLLKFHQKSLQDAIAAFDEPKKLRQYRSLLLPLSEEQLESFYKHLDVFASEQFVRFSSDNCQGKRVFQINFNIHPVSQLVTAGEADSEVLP